MTSPFFAATVFWVPYSDFLEKERPSKPESKAETLKKLRIERYEERQDRVKAQAQPGTEPPPKKD